MSEKILIIDAMNTFIRNYVADPTIGLNGEPIGGCRGFLKTLQKLLREINPEKVIVVWDGGSSSKRRALSKQYKEGRKPLKLNRAYGGMSTEEEIKNRYDQVAKTINYLNLMPVMQLLVEDVEADDIIGYLVSLPSLSEDYKIIVSMDKDFFQLCDDKTIVYRPVQDRFLTKDRIVEDYGIHPKNFAVARAMDGDKSDNIQGVKGVGLKTVAKRLSFLSEDRTYTLKEVFEHCSVSGEKIKFFKDVLREKKKIELNYKLMQLYNPIFSSNTALKINESLKSFVPSLNKMKIIKHMYHDGISEYDWEPMFKKFKMMLVEHRHYLKHST